MIRDTKSGSKIYINKFGPTLKVCHPWYSIGVWLVHDQGRRRKYNSMSILLCLCHTLYKIIFQIFTTTKMYIYVETLKCFDIFNVILSSQKTTLLKKSQNSCKNYTIFFASCIFAIDSRLKYPWIPHFLFALSALCEFFPWII